MSPRCVEVASNGEVTTLRAVVLVEGNSDRVALHSLAQRSGRDLAAEGIEVVAMGGITNTRAFASRYGPHGLDQRTGRAGARRARPANGAGWVSPGSTRERGRLDQPAGSRQARPAVVQAAGQSLRRRT